MNWDRPTLRFLVYLERLSQACIAHDADEIDKLLRLHLSSHLPRAVLDEVEFCRRTGSATLRAPLKVMRHLHKMRQLAAAAAEPTPTPQLSLAMPDARRSTRPGSAASRRRVVRRRK